MWKTGLSISKFLSVLLNPLTMPLYSIMLPFAYANFYGLYFNYILYALLCVFIFSCLLPTLFTLALWGFRYIWDIHDIRQYERIFPLIIFFISSFAVPYYFYHVGTPLWLVGLVAAPTIIGFFALLITLFWKISLHMLGIGGLIGGVLSVCFNVTGTNLVFLFMILFLLAGCLGVSRLYLKKSTPAQVYVGFLLGVVLSYLSVMMGASSLMIFLK